jgi:non-specific serine/threonine protein kinase
MIDKTISHYKITEKLGEGGMGEVYLADDLKLERQVAIKFLPEHLTKDKENIERFEREAKAAAALNHPNIVTIYDVLEEDDQLCIVMEYVNGKSLRELINEYNLGLDKIIDIIRQLSEGLSKAHKAGIVHRDIKPENIIIDQDARVKILDFGLAKLKGVSKLTKETSTLGTIHYMSPEQIRGSQVDQRSDIWSLGVVLYEMLMGNVPFKADYDQAVLYAIQNEEPEPVDTITTDLNGVIKKALAKDPDERYQRLEDFIDDFKIVGSGVDEKSKSKLNRYVKYSVILIAIVIVGYFLKPYIEFGNTKTFSLKPENTVAVLPFEVISNEEEDRILSDGFHDDIITQFVKVKELKPTARKSVIRYRDSSKSLREIGEELNVNYILTCSFRKVGNKIRINVQLIDSRSEEQIWAELYDREYSDIFAIQSDIAQNIASVLKATLTTEEKNFLNRIPTESLEAYEYYQKGNYYWYNFATKETNLKAAQMYEKATAIDQNFVLAYAKLAYVSIALYMEWDDNTKERLEKAELALDRAIALAPDLPEIHLAKGSYYGDIEKDYNLAYKEYETALKYQPNNTDILDELGIFFLREGNPEKAVDYFIRSFELNPYGLWSGGWVSNCYNRLRNWKEAEKWANTYISNHPDNKFGYARKWQILLYGTGNLSEASEVIEEGMRHTNSKFVLQRVMIELYGRKYEKALKVLISDSSHYNNFYLMNYNLQKAEIYRILGEMSNSEQNYRSAKILYESLIKENPYRAEYYSNLGLTLAGLGNKKTAIQMGLKAVELLPIKSEYTLRPEQMLLNLSYIYIMTGDYDKAITQIEFLLSIPSQLTVWQLKLDPIFDPLRNKTKFKELLIENSEDNYAR